MMKGGRTRLRLREWVGVGHMICGWARAVTWLDWLQFRIGSGDGREDGRRVPFGISPR